MSRCVNLGVVLIIRFPRVSGDEPSELQKAQEAAAFSPRERG